MTTATISAKGWIEIPAEFRKKYDLKTGDQVRLVDYGGVLAIIPVLANPIQEAQGLLKGPKSLTKALLNEHRPERVCQGGQPTVNRCARGERQNDASHS